MPQKNPFKITVKARCNFVPGFCIEKHQKTPFLKKKDRMVLGIRYEAYLLYSVYCYTFTCEAFYLMMHTMRIDKINVAYHQPYRTIYGTLR